MNKKSATLISVQKELNNWRNSKSHPQAGPIPRGIWDDILELTKMHSIGQLTTQLRITKPQIIRKMQQANMKTTQKEPTPVDFVEVRPVNKQELIVNFENANDCNMQLNITTSQLTSVIEAFCNATISNQ